MDILDILTTNKVIDRKTLASFREEMRLAHISAEQVAKNTALTTRYCSQPKAIFSAFRQKASKAKTFLSKSSNIFRKNPPFIIISFPSVSNKTSSKSASSIRTISKRETH